MKWDATSSSSAALIALPVLVLPLAWWGGWWLIPADLAWLLVTALDGRAERRAEDPTA
jgi:hypothetical protein